MDRIGMARVNEKVTATLVSGTVSLRPKVVSLDYKICDISEFMLLAFHS